MEALKLKMQGIIHQEVYWNAANTSEGASSGGVVGANDGTEGLATHNPALETRCPHLAPVARPRPPPTTSLHIGTPGYQQSHNSREEGNKITLKVVREAVCSMKSHKIDVTQGYSSEAGTE